MINVLPLLLILGLFIFLRVVDTMILNHYLPINYTSRWAKAISNLCLAALIFYDLDKNQNVQVISSYFAVICLIEFSDVALDSILDFKKAFLMTKNK